MDEERKRAEYRTVKGTHWQTTLYRKTANPCLPQDGPVGARDDSSHGTRGGEIASFHNHENMYGCWET